MSEKPEALRLAEWIESDPIPGDDKIASTLRRLHAENERLTATLKAREDEILTHSEAVYEATRLFSEEREKNERLRELLTEARGAKWLVVQDNLLDRIDAALRREET